MKKLDSGGYPYKRYYYRKTQTFLYLVDREHLQDDHQGGGVHVTQEHCGAHVEVKKEPWTGEIIQFVDSNVTSDRFKNLGTVFPTDTADILSDGVERHVWREGHADRPGAGAHHDGGQGGRHEQRAHGDEGQQQRGGVELAMEMVYR